MSIIMSSESAVNIHFLIICEKKMAHVAVTCSDPFDIELKRPKTNSLKTSLHFEKVKNLSVSTYFRIL